MSVPNSSRSYYSRSSSISTLQYEQHFLQPNNFKRALLCVHVCVNGKSYSMSCCFWEREKKKIQPTRQGCALLGPLPRAYLPAPSSVPRVPFPLRRRWRAQASVVRPSYKGIYQTFNNKKK